MHFTFSCWTLAVVADVSSLWLGEAAWHWSAGLLTVGCLMAIVAASAGLFELSRVPEGAAMRHAYWHMSLMLLALAIFSTRLLLRLDHFSALPPDHLSLAMDAGGFFILIVGGWLGGVLVYGYGVGSK